MGDLNVYTYKSNRGKKRTEVAEKLNPIHEVGYEGVVLFFSHSTISSKEMEPVEIFMMKL